MRKGHGPSEHVQVWEGCVCQLQVREHGLTPSLFLKPPAPRSELPAVFLQLQRLLPGERE